MKIVKLLYGILAAGLLYFFGYLITSVPSISAMYAENALTFDILYIILIIAIGISLKLICGGRFYLFGAAPYIIFLVMHTIIAVNAFALPKWLTLVYEFSYISLAPLNYILYNVQKAINGGNTINGYLAETMIAMSGLLLYSVGFMVIRTKKRSKGKRVYG